jgi:uncharacterized membrane protein YidH (DUF202 family)
MRRYRTVHCQDVVTLDDDSIVFKYETLSIKPQRMHNDTDRAARSVWVAQAIKLYIWISVIVIAVSMYSPVIQYINRTTGGIVQWSSAPPPDLAAELMYRIGITITIGAVIITTAAVTRLLQQHQKVRAKQARGGSTRA